MILLESSFAVMCQSTGICFAALDQGISSKLVEVGDCLG